MRRLLVLGVLAGLLGLAAGLGCSPQANFVARAGFCSKCAVIDGWETVTDQPTEEETALCTNPDMRWGICVTWGHSPLLDPDGYRLTMSCTENVAPSACMSITAGAPGLYQRRSYPRRQSCSWMFSGDRDPIHVNDCPYGAPIFEGTSRICMTTNPFTPLDQTRAVWINYLQFNIYTYGTTFFGNSGCTQLRVEFRNVDNSNYDVITPSDVPPSNFIIRSEITPNPINNADPPLIEDSIFYTGVLGASLMEGDSVPCSFCTGAPIGTPITGSCALPVVDTEIIPHVYDLDADFYTALVAANGHNAAVPMGLCTGGVCAGLRFGSDEPCAGAWRRVRFAEPWGGALQVFPLYPPPSPPSPPPSPPPPAYTGTYERCINGTHCALIQIGVQFTCPIGMTKSGQFSTVCAGGLIPLPRPTVLYQACRDNDGFFCRNVLLGQPCPPGFGFPDFDTCLRSFGIDDSLPLPPAPAPPSPPPPPFVVPPAVDADHFPFRDPATWTGGVPNLADLFNRYLAIDVLDPLPDGALCTPRSHLDGRSVCDAGACTAIVTARGICEAMTCRRGSPWAGTCVNAGWVPAGEPCYAGCLANDEGTCNGHGTCTGIPQTIAEGYQTVGFPQPDPAIHGDCNSISCSQRPLLFQSDPLIYKPPPFDYAPFVPTALDVALRIESQIITTEGLSDWVLVLQLTGTPCSDGNACTQGDACSAGLCIAPRSKSSWCKQTAYYECNVTTGACDVPVSGGVCTAPCGTADNGFSGYISSPGVCQPSPTDNSWCATIPGSCVTPVCVGTITGIPPGAPIYVPAGAIISNAQLFPVITLGRTCPVTVLADGSACAQARLAGNRCAREEICQIGNCVITKTTNCTAATLDQPCSIPALATCDPPTGFCLVAPAPVGTPCDDDNPCTDGDACGPGAQCLAGTLRTCPFGGNPCIRSSYCDQADGLCVFNFSPSSTTCATGAPPNATCPSFGTCIQGACAVADGVCPTPPNQCLFSTCDASGGCVSAPRPNYIACDDGLQCTVDDFCLSGGCVSGPLNTCTPPNECWAATGPCSEATANGGCDFVPLTGPSCEGGFGVCGNGLCVITCNLTCAQGETFIVRLGECVCDCNPGYFGPTCNLRAAVSGSFAFDFVTDAWSWLLRTLGPYVLLGLLITTLITMFSLAAMLLCFSPAAQQPVVLTTPDGRVDIK